MQKIVKNKVFVIKLLIIIIGFIAGLAYWYFIGCSSNSCPITSKWYLSALYGGLIGYLIGGFINDKKKNNKENKYDN